MFLFGHVFGQDLLSPKELSGEKLYIHIVDTFFQGYDDRTYSGFIGSLRDVPIEPLRVKAGVEYPEVYRLVLGPSHMCENRVDFSKFPNLQELVLEQYCAGLPESDAKDLSKLQILRIGFDLDLDSCFPTGTDFQTAARRGDRQCKQNSCDGLYFLNNLRELEVNSDYIGTNFIGERVFDLPKLERLNLVYSSGFFPQGIVLHPRLMKNSHYGDYPFSDPLDTESGCIVPPKKYSGNLLDYFYKTTIPENGIYEEYYPAENYRWIEKYREYGFSVSFSDSLYAKKSAGSDSLYKPRLKCRGEIRNGKLHGPWIYFYMDGQVSEERYYDNGVEIGTWLSYGLHRERNNLMDRTDCQYFMEFDRGKVMNQGWKGCH